MQLARIRLLDGFSNSDNLAYGLFALSWGTDDRQYNDTPVNTASLAYVLPGSQSSFRTQQLEWDMSFTYASLQREGLKGPSFTIIYFS